MHANPHFVGRGMGSWQCWSLIKQAFNTAVGSGVWLVDKVGGWVEDVFCRMEHPIRITDSGNIGFTVGNGQRSVSAGFNKGESNTTVEFMDMNGDRYPDSVTKAGVRFNGGSSVRDELGTATPFPMANRATSITAAFTWKAAWAC